MSYVVRLIIVQTSESNERVSNSIALNIAEGMKYSPKDKCRYFDIAIGSSFECSACLDILLRKKVITEVQLKNGKERLEEIVAMLVGLIKSKSERIYEDVTEYKS
jgi:four helix bundle protein